MCRPFAVNLFYDTFVRHSSAVKYSSVKWDKKVLKCIKEEIDMKSLLILGAGGFGQMVKETAMMLGYEDVVFLDDAAKGPDVIGKCCDYVVKHTEYPVAVAAFWQ